ncbi:hypothetical protein GCM10010300_77840 [Streptomyces olivaceoviridis]|uniref:nuclear transport factor 2 family protein n=1 Tax=Streptomyces olivaceoviridis TaxID=1921 RepID=UPI0019B43644|nr:hypothetical protein GCM10010300_77840 [Streptomyces olivaceoviridis]
MTPESERAVQAAIDRETRLLDPEVRACPDRVLELLDPDFTEIGASGRRWDVETVLTVTSGGSVSGTNCDVQSRSPRECSPVSIERRGPPFHRIGRFEAKVVDLMVSVSSNRRMTWRHYLLDWLGAVQWR